MPPFFRILFYTLVGLALIALGWEVAARLMDNPTRLPSMIVVVNKAITLAQSADYIRHATDSGSCDERTAIHFRHGNSTLPVRFYLQTSR